MPSSHSALRSALLLHSTWLRGLRWVGLFEYWPSLLLLLLIVLSGVAGVWQSGSANGLSTPLAHLLLFCTLAALAPRWLAAPLLGTLCISLLNYCVVLLIQPPALGLIDTIYCGLGLAAGLALLLRTPALRRHWAAVSGYRSQDDYRWLLTSAPLWLRWRLHDELAALPAPGQAASAAGAN